MYMYINILDMYINIKMGGGGINNKLLFHIDLDL